MKVAEAHKSSAATNTVQTKRRPFFNKNGRGSFFSKSNESTTSFLRPAIIQPKLTIGQPNDKYEIEADAIADQVVQKLEQPRNNIDPENKPAKIQANPILPSVAQPKCSHCEEKEKIQEKEDEFLEANEEIHTKLSTAEIPEEPGAGSNIQTKSNTNQERQMPDLQSRLNSSKGTGSPLGSDMHSKMGSAFGTDFSNVRVHTDNEAVQMNKELGAQAFTHGNHIYFNQGKYDTNSNSGKHLLAHELTHTVQQGSSQNKVQRQLLSPPPQSGGFPGVLERQERQNFPADTSTSGSEVIEEELNDQRMEETSGGEVTEAESREQEIRDELGMSNCPHRLNGPLGDIIVRLGDYPIHDGGNYNKRLDTELLDLTLVPFYTPLGVGIEIDGEVNGYVKGGIRFGPLTLRDILLGIDFAITRDNLLTDLFAAAPLGILLRYLGLWDGGGRPTPDLLEMLFLIRSIKAKANLQIPAEVNLEIGLEAQLEVAPAFLGVDLDGLASLAFGLRALMGVSGNADFGGDIDMIKSPGNNLKFCHAKGLDLDFLLNFGLSGFLRGSFLWFESEMNTDLANASWATNIALGSRIGIVYDGGFQTANSDEGNNSEGIFVDLPGVVETLGKIGEFAMDMLEESGIKDEVANEVDQDVGSNTSGGGRGCDQPNVNEGDIVCLSDRPADFSIGEIVDAFLFQNIWMIRYRPYQMGGTSSIPAYSEDCLPVFRVVTNSNECLDIAEELERDPCVPEAASFTPSLQSHGLRSALRNARRDLLVRNRIIPTSGNRAYSWNRNVAIAQLIITYLNNSTSIMNTDPFMNEARGGRHSEDRILSQMYHISDRDPQIMQVEMFRLVSERQECQEGNRTTGRPACSELLDRIHHPRSSNGALIITHTRVSHFIAPLNDSRYNNRLLKEAYCLGNNTN